MVFTSSFGGVPSTMVDNIYLESGSFDIGLTCSFPMTYTATSIVHTEKAVPDEFEPSGVVTQSDDLSDLARRITVNIHSYSDSSFTNFAEDGPVEIASPYYYLIAAPLQMPIRKLK